MIPEELIAEADAVYLDTSALAKIDYEEDGSRFVRVLAYHSRLKKYTSRVGLAEWIGVMARKIRQSSDVTFLFTCRQSLKEFEIGHFKFVEPPSEQIDFLGLSKRLVGAYPRLGGADIWHLMAALELNAQIENSVFFSFDGDLIASAMAEQLIAVNGKGLSVDALEGELRKRNKTIDS